MQNPRFAMLSVFGLLLTGLSGLALLASERVQEPPLKILEIDYEPAESQLRVVLRNESEQVVTAWGITCSAVDASGSFLGFGIGRDRFASPKESLSPGETWDVTTPLELDGNPDLHAVDVEVSYAILEDLTITGDQTEGRVVLVARQALRDVTQLIHDELMAARDAAEAQKRLVRLQQRLLEPRRGRHPEFIAGDYDSELGSLAETDVSYWLQAIAPDSMAATDSSLVTLEMARVGVRKQLAEIERAKGAIPAREEVF